MKKDWKKVFAESVGVMRKRITIAGNRVDTTVQAVLVQELIQNRKNEPVDIVVFEGPLLQDTEILADFIVETYNRDFSSWLNRRENSAKAQEALFDTELKGL